MAGTFLYTRDDRFSFDLWCGVEDEGRKSREADLVVLTSSTNAPSTNTSTQHSIVDQGKRTYGE